MSNTLANINYLLGASKKPPKEKIIDDYLMPWEKELLKKEGYEQYQLDEEESELEDDDLYEKGEDWFFFFLLCYNILGYTDVLKLNSCMTLFNYIDPSIDIFIKIIDKFYNGKKDQRTIDILVLW